MIFHKIIPISAVFLSVIFLAGLVDCEEGRDSRATHYLGNVGTKQFFLVDGLVDWQDARTTCWSMGMKMVTLNTPAEQEFVFRQLQVELKGPFWLGGRDVANLSMYRWTESNAAPDPNDPNYPATDIDDFVRFYNWQEQGWMALMMSNNVGSIHGAYIFSPSAKALCQSG